MITKKRESEDYRVYFGYHDCITKKREFEDYRVIYFGSHDCITNQNRYTVIGLLRKVSQIILKLILKD
jgi:hypothetical protein